MAPKMIYCLSILVVLVGVCECAGARAGAILDAHYYDKTCPEAENIIYEAVRNATTFDPKVPARILRMFFHDCFIRVLSLSVYLYICIYVYIKC